MPYPGLSSGMSPMDFDDDKKDFSLISRKFKSNKFISDFSKNAGDSKRGDDDEVDLDEMLKNMKGNLQVRDYSRNRNITFENLAQDLDKQKKREKLLSWRDRELFIDKNRAMGVNMGETDNKKALEARKKQLKKEKLKYGLAGIDEEENKLPWEIFYSNVS